MFQIGLITRKVMLCCNSVKRPADCCRFRQGYKHARADQASHRAPYCTHVEHRKIGANLLDPHGFYCLLGHASKLTSAVSPVSLVWEMTLMLVSQLQIQLCWTKRSGQATCTAPLLMKYISRDTSPSLITMSSFKYTCKRLNQHCSSASLGLKRRRNLPLYNMCL